MRRQYRCLLAMAATGAWARLPSYCSAHEHLPEVLVMLGDTRLFLCTIKGAGVGFEYTMFLNAAECSLHCLFQPGPYLEGHPSLIHGGAITAIIDGMLGTCTLAVARKVMTANLSIDYLVPVPLGAAVLLDGHAERLEGRKVFLSCHVQSVEGDTLHARATCLFIWLDPTEHRTREEDGGR
ncbi:acyl-coenzyme A thioesterase THEM4-like [Accipiter gentilis]|uniref:acyl-coenzyme A thioesterase THEM4-like n=1 Tax=Astur gentilis TaxID=8957 RepID=UPI00210FB340|nr:acyl-coenzyme A thioesterase THEM4-like [Accipiter gentilis]